MRPSLVAVIFVCLIMVSAAFSQKVDEAPSSIVFRDGVAVVQLAVECDRSLRNALTTIELVDTNGVVRMSGGGERDLTKGRQTLEYRIPISTTISDPDDGLGWYRLRYRVADATGIISVSQIASELFELRIIATSNIMSGMGYRVRVRAMNPFSETPAAGVDLSARLAIDKPGDTDEQTIYSGSGRTDSDGFAVIDFPIPAELVLGGEGEIKVTGRRNGLAREAEEELRLLKHDLQFLMMTDKPIYQPEQTLSVRGILFKGGEAKTILANEELEFRVSDEDDTLLYREKLSTSPFGIAAINWRIPMNAKLGEYKIKVLGSDGEEISRTNIKVSRYDLPNFVVNAKVQKPYYLPEDKEAEIEIRADYLFGKPVTKGKVRVVQENSREWNYKEQKYDVDEGEVREGELDTDGKFIAKFDLADSHEDLEDDDWRKHEDIRFAAYLTDQTTNKTEQRRFDVRVSREPIHVYFVGIGYNNNPSLPITGYVTTFYADGSPAKCDVEIKAADDEDEKHKTVARLKTNSYGVGRLEMPRPNIGDPDDDLNFQAFATDASGRRGSILEKEVYFDEDDNRIQVVTNRTIYKPGEEVKISLRSTIKSGLVYVDIVDGWTVVASHFASLNNGRAELSVPYDSLFMGELTVAAFIEDPDDDDDLVKATLGIIFPAQQGIEIKADFEKAVYKPNEEASASFSVIDAVGKAVESALGIVILDKAVEERARTDAEFGSMFQGLGGWLGYGKSFAGINVKDLNALDLSKPISPEMQLVAEVMLHDSYYYPNLFHSKRYFEQARSVFGYSMQRQLQPMADALANAYSTRNFLHPTNEAQLRNITALYNVDPASYRDPWGMPYRSRFSVDKAVNRFSFVSAGPDKTFETRDDIVAYSNNFQYFTPVGRVIDSAITNYHKRTGEFVRDEKTLLTELGMDEILDRWGRPYRIIFNAEGRKLQITIRSTGPDGKFEEYFYRGDDFQVWSNLQDYFAPIEMRISESQKKVTSIPMNETEFRQQLKEAGITDEMLRDGNGKALHITAVRTSRYWDKVTLENVQVYGDERRTERRVITPVTQDTMQFTIRGVGRDGRAGTYDDVTFMQVVHVLAEQTKDDAKPVPVIKKISYTANSGTIAGVVTDANGAAIAGANVTVTETTTSASRSTTSDSSGRFIFGALPTGTYSIRVRSAGFKDTVMTEIKVLANSTAQANIILEVGDVSSVVDVSASSDSVMNSTDMSVGTTITTSQIEALPINARNAMSLIALQPGITIVTKSGEHETPRVREYFPETLLWRPEVITDADGRATMKFRMADNITTWKMYTVASTKNGKVGFAEKEVTAFQAFFVDLDPPKFLTNGDEIYLPTQVRNYTEKKQMVDVTMSPANWFSFIDQDKKQVDVASGQTENAVFGFKAITPIKDGKQRVTAMAEADSDAIEKPVTVRPDGREIVATDSRFFNRTNRFDVNFPANTIPGTHRAELKVYPNLMAHVAESVEGLLQRPYGCGEQTISSTYPNLMILKFAGTGERRRISEKAEREARKNLQDGYDRLVGYQVASGGFSYWGGRDEADLALTAYALRFLADASVAIAVDPAIIAKAEEWLIAQQRADGSWNKKYRWETIENESRAKSLTTYVARTLAMLKAKASEPGAMATGPKAPEHSKQESALTKALDYLRLRNSQIDDPYSLALLGLALKDAGDENLARVIADKLETLGRDEAGGMYWNLESNTVFNGWGTAGRIETTALAAQLLMKLDRSGAEKKYEGITAKAMLFLLKNKDRYGVWYSTQTTINVLDAFIASLETAEANNSQKLDVILNGETIQTLDIGPDKLEQIVVDLGGKLVGSANALELRASNGSPVMAQLVSAHYIPWADADSTGRNINQSRAVSLEYACDRTDAAIMQEVTCSVAAERVGFRGYGMLLAEIGTPPGADVSRESLQAAIENDWSISKYEVLPDRVLVYMWAKAGGTKFNFKFRPRYGINAQTPASVVYDYYNPEAQAVNAPIRFVVR